MDILEDINEVFDYLWDDERKHYHSLDERERGGHVFESLKRLRGWVDSVQQRTGIVRLCRLPENGTTTDLPTDREHKGNIDPRFPDTEGLGYQTFLDGGIVGYVDCVNGSEAEASSEFQATRHELKIVAKYWYRELTDIDLFWVQHQTSGSTEWRTAKYAARRIARIRNIIGSQVDEGIAEVDSELCEQLEEAVWNKLQALREPKKDSV